MTRHFSDPNNVVEWSSRFLLIMHLVAVASGVVTLFEGIKVVPSIRSPVPLLSIKLLFSCLLLYLYNVWEFANSCKGGI